jgi:hypothetical protein
MSPGPAEPAISKDDWSPLAPLGHHPSRTWGSSLSSTGNQWASVWQAGRCTPPVPVQCQNLDWMVKCDFSLLGPQPQSPCPIVLLNQDLKWVGTEGKWGS